MRQRLERYPRAFELAHGSFTIGRLVGRARRFTGAPAFALNMYAHEWAHKFLYAPDVLGLALATPGLTAPEVFSFGESVHPALVGVDRRETPEDTFAMEATRL